MPLCDMPADGRLWPANEPCLLALLHLLKKDKQRDEQDADHQLQSALQILRQQEAPNGIQQPRCPQLELRCTLRNHAGLLCALMPCSPPVPARWSSTLYHEL